MEQERSNLTNEILASNVALDQVLKTQQEVNPLICIKNVLHERCDEVTVMHDVMPAQASVVSLVVDVYSQMLFQPISGSENSKRYIEPSNRTTAKNDKVYRWFVIENKKVDCAI